MTLAEFIKQLEKTQRNEERVNCLETVYKQKLPESVAQLVSMNINVSFDVGRVLEVKEIISASDICGVDFIEKSIIPCIDCFDNDFIIFDLKSEKWMLYNIVDNIRFGKTYSDLKECLKSFDA